MSRQNPADQLTCKVDFYVFSQDKPVKLDQNLRVKKERNVTLSKESNESIPGQFDSVERIIRIVAAEAELALLHSSGGS